LEFDLHHRKSSRRPDIFADWLAPPPPTHRFFFSTEPD
jgi:hypothetical protein